MIVNQFKPWVGEDEYKAIAECFKNNWITEGPKANAFAERLLDLIQVEFGVFAPNGTLAIYLALRALGIGPGDEVLVPDFTFIGTATAVQMTGATPVFVEVNPYNFQIDVSQVEQFITERTKVLLPVHIYGTAANMDEVMSCARKYGLQVVEDAAQAIGVRYKGKHSGSFGVAGTFSFFADKTITTAEGGFIVTDNEEVYQSLLYLRNQGRLDRGTFIHPNIGYNFRMTDIQAAMGLAQINKLDEIIQKKEFVKNFYHERINSISEVTFFKPEKNANWIPFRVGILVNDAHQLMDFMKENGVEPRTFFYPLHRQPCFKYLADENPQNMLDEKFTNAIYAHEHGICLPSYPTMTGEELDFVCRIIEKYYGR